jgi:hypothetical protein
MTQASDHIVVGIGPLRVADTSFSHIGATSVVIDARARQYIQIPN